MFNVASVGVDDVVWYARHGIQVLKQLSVDLVEACVDVGSGA